MDIFINVLAGSTPFLIAILGGVGWLYRHEKERRDEVERQLSSRKFEAYTNLIDLLIGMLHQQKVKGKLDDKKLVGGLQDAQKKLLLYGSDEALSAFIRLSANAYKGSDFAEMIKAYSGMLLAIRRDMGNANTTIGHDDLMRMMISDYDDYLKKLAET